MNHSPGKKCVGACWIVAALVACAAPAWGTWYSDVEMKEASSKADDIDIMVKELRYPWWAESTYYATWNATLKPKGPGLYSGFTGGVNKDQRGGLAADLPTEKRLATATDKPGGMVFTFWDPASQVLYCGPEFNATPYSGEGAGATCGSGGNNVPWIRAGRWYQVVLRSWTSDDTQRSETYVGQWVKDVAANQWHHLATFRTPGRFTGWDGNMGFLEDFANGGRDIREIHRGAAYFRQAGIWKSCPTVSVRSRKSNEPYGPLFALASIENGSAISIITSTNDKKLPAHLPADGQVTRLSCHEPDQPTWDKPRVSGVVATVWEGHAVVTWDIAADAAPQLGYRIEVFDNTGFTGAPVTVVAERQAHVRSRRLDLATNKPHIRLTITDIFDQTIAVPARIDGGLPMPASSRAATLPGVKYALFNLDDTAASVPDTGKLNPVKTGILSRPSLAPAGNGEGPFAMRFEGLLKAPATGAWVLALRSASGARLWIDHQLIANDDGRHGPSERRFPLLLQAGLHPMRLEYYHVSGRDARLELEWEGPGQNLAPIPAPAFEMVDDGKLPLFSLLPVPTPSRVTPVEIACKLDPRGSEIASVDYYLGKMRIGSARQPPWSVSFLLPEGPQQIVAQLTCADGRSIEAAPVTAIGQSEVVEGWTLAGLNGADLPHVFRSAGANGYDYAGDGAWFLYRPVKGDFTLTARVAHFTTDDDWRNRVGLMARTDAKSNADENTIYRAGLGDVTTSINGRETGSGASDWFVHKPAPWLRLVRQGQLFRGYCSMDGNTWEKVSEHYRDFPREIPVGTYVRTEKWRSKTLMQASLTDISLQNSAWNDGVEPGQPDFYGPRISGLVRSLRQPKTLVVRTTDNGMFVSGDAGTTWKHASDAINSRYKDHVRSIAVHPDDARIMFCGLGQNGEGELWKTLDGGASWKLVSRAMDFDGAGSTALCPETIVFDPRNPQRLLAAGETTGLFRSIDGGLTWKCLGLAGQRISRVLIQSESQPYAVALTVPDDQLPRLGRGKPAKPLHDATAGHIWVARDDAFEQWKIATEIQAIGFINYAVDTREPQRGILTTTHGPARTDDFKNRIFFMWQAPRIPGGQPCFAIFCHAQQGSYTKDPFYYLAVLGTQPSLLFGKGSGKVWKPFGSPAFVPGDATAIDVDPAGPIEIIRVVTGRAIFQTADSGKTWQRIFTLE